MGKVFKNFRDESRGTWGVNLEASENVSNDQLRMGAMLRIADATEKMASNYTNLQNEKDKYERWYRRELESSARMAKRVSALQGVITRMKKAKKEGK
jgi:hypothetical protein